MMNGIPSHTMNEHNPADPWKDLCMAVISSALEDLGRKDCLERSTAIEFFTDSNHDGYAARADIDPGLLREKAMMKIGEINDTSL